MSNDCLALAVTCGTGESCYLHVDDLSDPDEVEITSEQIHVTVLTVCVPQSVLHCFKLSTVSARTLVNELTAAVARRKGGEPWDR
jgi:hypothetical protein